MSIGVWSAFAATLIAVVLVPGPAVLLVVSHGLAGDARAGVKATVGIAASSALFFLLTALGLSSVLLASATAFVWARWLGVGYLAWMGLQMIQTAAGAVAPGDPGPESALPRGRRGRPFWDALVLQSASPNALAFFTAVLPQFIDPSRAAAPQFWVLGITSVTIEGVVLTAYVVAAARGRRVFSGPSAAVRLRWFGGWTLVAVALGLAVSKPPQP